MMADRLDAVAVGITEEGRIIGSVIAAQARRAIIGAASRNAGVPEGIDLALPARLEAPVPAEGLFRLRALADRDIDAVRIGSPRPLAIAEPVLAPADLDHAERLHDGVVEALGSGDVGDSDGYVVEHAASTLTVPATYTGLPTPSSAAPALPAASSCAQPLPRASLSLLQRSLPARWPRTSRWRAWHRRA